MNATEIRALCNVSTSAPVSDKDVRAYYEAGFRDGSASMPGIPKDLRCRGTEARDILSRVYYSGHADGIRGCVVA